MKIRGILSVDLREAIVASFDARVEEVTIRFKVSLAAVKNLLEQRTKNPGTSDYGIALPDAKRG